ncbi:GAF and ANTAR domain-containing protein [Actinophytocola sp.]|jgi:GAF domain-containing protein|uniref:GAF and ANTAR domain-containing protein n=1 Tax=Actinophytocola sp. TaxID=1872138 RepID=UPI002ED8B2CF
MARDSGAESLATALARMARDLLSQETVQQTLDRIVAHAVSLVRGCEFAGILTVEGGRLRTLASSDEAARESDRIQVELGEGPCLDSTLEEHHVFRIADVTTAEDRWPRYAPKARELGIGSAMGFLLYTRDRNLGALTLYGRAPNAFTEHSEHVGWLLASHAAVAFASARSDAQLQQAVASRQEIGEALGIVMERHKLTGQQAFEMLRKESQERNVKLRELARMLTETGELPSQ